MKCTDRRRILGTILTLVPVGEAAPDLVAFSSVGDSDLAAPPACWGTATGDAVVAAAVATVTGAWALVAAFGAPCFLASWAPRELGTDTLRGGGADRGPLGFVSDATAQEKAADRCWMAKVVGDVALSFEQSKRGTGKNTL